MISQRENFLRHVAQTSPQPLGLEVSHAEGCYIYSTDGNKYLDLISGISVSALGHSAPEVKDAIISQSQKHLHTMVYGEHVQSSQTEYAAALTQNLHENLDCVYFTNSGSEATEGAMKLAKRITGRSGFVSCVNAYHGSTQGALSLAGNEMLKQNFRPLLPYIKHIRFNSEEDFNHITEKTSAVFIEPLQAEAGCVAPHSGYLKKLREHCTAIKTLLVFDEIQTGFGRTGKLWAFEHENVIPDVLLLGKALGGGLPLGAFISSRKNMLSLTHNPVLGHITTFGGHPLSCAAGVAFFNTLLTKKIADDVEQKEKLFRELLQHKKIKYISGKGLLLAVDVGNFENVQKVISLAHHHGVLTDWFLFNECCLRIAPPLIISEEEIRFACRVLTEALDNL